MPPQLSHKKKNPWSLFSFLKTGQRPNVAVLILAIACATALVRVVDIAGYAFHHTETPQGLTRSATAQAESGRPGAVSLADSADKPLNTEDIRQALSGVGVTTPALAQASPTPPAPQPSTTGDASPPQLTVPDNRDFTASEIEVLQALSRRREELDQRERNINESGAMLKAAEREVDRKIAELNALRDELKNLLETQQKMEESRIVSLVRIYEAMKPKEAAIIFNSLDDDVLLAVVARMNERRLSPILASMDPAKARMITIRLAEEGQLPPPDRSDSPPILNLPSQPLASP